MLLNNKFALNDFKTKLKKFKLINCNY